MEIRWEIKKVEAMEQDMPEVETKVSRLPEEETSITLIIPGKEEDPLRIINLRETMVGCLPIGSRDINKLIHPLMSKMSSVEYMGKESQGIRLKVSVKFLEVLRAELKFSQVQIMSLW